MSIYIPCIKICLVVRRVGTYYKPQETDITVYVFAIYTYSLAIIIVTIIPLSCGNILIILHAHCV